MLLRQRQLVGAGKDLDQGNFEWRKWKRAIKSVPTLVPLTGDAGMPIKKRNDNVSFVAIRFAVRTFPNKIAQHGFRNLGIDFICKRMPQHGRGNRQIKQAKPTAHKRQSASDIPLVLQRNRLKTDRDGNLAIDGLLQEFFVKTLNSSQYGKFPFGIFSQVFPSIKPGS